MKAKRHYEIEIYDRESYRIYLKIANGIEIIHCVKKYDGLLDTRDTLPSVLGSHSRIKEITKEIYEKTKKLLENKVNIITNMKK